MTAMKKLLASEFFVQLFALLLAIIVVHTVYVGVVRPNAEAIMKLNQELRASGQDSAPPRSFYVVLKDYEQETCFVLMFWAIGIMGRKGWQIYLQKRLLLRDLIHLPPGTSILPEDSREYSRPIQALPDEQRRMLVPRALLNGLRRFGSTSDIQSASAAIKEISESEADRLDSELAMIRYIAWAIPSIGFIGTVRGIGAALGEAHRAVEGDIAGVTANLGVAFNSTFVALVISILIMFLVHQIQLQQERLVLDTQEYCDDRLLCHLHVN